MREPDYHQRLLVPLSGNGTEYGYFEATIDEPNIGEDTWVDIDFRIHDGNNTANIAEFYAARIGNGEFDAALARLDIIAKGLRRLTTAVERAQEAIRVVEQEALQVEQARVALSGLD